MEYQRVCQFTISSAIGKIIVFRLFKKHAIIDSTLPPVLLRVITPS
jgi:hypothetical protein